MSTDYAVTQTANVITTNVDTTAINLLVSSTPASSALFRFSFSIHTYLLYPVTLSAYLNDSAGSYTYSISMLTSPDGLGVLTDGLSTISTDLIPTIANSNGTGDYTILATKTISTTGYHEFSLDLSEMTRIMSTSINENNPWNGSLNLWLTCSSINITDTWGASASAHPPYLTAASSIAYANRFTGLVGPWSARSRVDECPVCGGRSPREEWAYSAWHKRMSCAKCVDPKDPYEEPIYVPADEPLGGGEDV